MAAIYSYRPRKIENLAQYVASKVARQNTALIDGKIVLDGKVWEIDDYNKAFPEPELRYVVTQLDSTQVKNS